MNYALNNILPSPPDSRDLIYAATIPPLSLPRKVDLRLPNQEVENQGGIGSCTAHGVVSSLEHMCLREGATKDLSRLFLYYQTLKYENRIGQEGAYPRDAFKVAHKIGVCDEDVYEYNEALVSNEPHPEAYSEAAVQKIDRYERIPLGYVHPYDITSMNINVTAIKQALAAGYTVSIAMKVWRWFYYISGPIDLHIMFKGPTEGRFDYMGNHFINIVGYDDTLAGGSFILQNSWGTGWGDGGYAAYSYSLVGDFYEAWIIHGFMGEYGLPYTPQQTRVAQLYALIFNRAPEASGMNYWTYRMKEGFTDQQVAAEMWELSGLSKVSEEDAVANIYLKSLGRTVDAESSWYWAYKIRSEPVGRTLISFVDAIVEYIGEKNVAATVSKQLFQNKVDVGLYYSLTLAQDDVKMAISAFDNVTYETGSLAAVKEMLRQGVINKE